MILVTNIRSGHYHHPLSLSWSSSAPSSSHQQSHQRAWGRQDGAQDCKASPGQGSSLPNTNTKKTRRNTNICKYKYKDSIAGLAWQCCTWMVSSPVSGLAGGQVGYHSLIDHHHRNHNDHKDNHHPHLLVWLECQPGDWCAQFQYMTKSLQSSQIKNELIITKYAC